MNTPANEVSNHPVLSSQHPQSAHHGRQGAHQSRRTAAMTGLIGGLTALFVTASPLHAAELSVMAGQSIDLGRFHGVVHFTNEDDVYRVVATIADGEAGSPLRFSATLADDQSATISVPGKLGETGYRIEISRSGDKLIINEAGRSAGDPARPEM
jgi:hypothetical protein